MTGLPPRGSEAGGEPGRQLVEPALEIPDRPGWGIDLVDSAIKKHPYKRAWHRGGRFYPAGAVGYI